MRIPFNKTYQTGDEEKYMIDALRSGQICGNHTYCKKVLAMMKEKYGYDSAFAIFSGEPVTEDMIVLFSARQGLQHWRWVLFWQI